MRELSLSQGWLLKVRNHSLSLADELSDPQGWLSAEVPGIAHDTLWQAGQLPSPYESPSLAKLSPTFDQDFIYRLRFSVPEPLRQGPLRLRFEGLDTFAEIWLNGHKLAQTDNMFCEYSLPCEDKLCDGEQDLVIVFSSALRVGKERQARSGVRKVWNGDPCRVYVCKAQYHFGWDFGPSFLSTGP